MASWEGNLIRVRLVDVQLSKLGVVLKDRDTPPRVQVQDLLEGGVFERCGLVHKGDYVIQVNGFDTCEMTSSDVERLMSRLSSKETLTLLVRGPDGYRSYLRTIFSADGAPKTVRVSEPIPHTSAAKLVETVLVPQGTKAELHRRSTEKALPTETTPRDVLPRKNSCPSVDENGGLVITSPALGLGEKLRSRSPSPKPDQTGSVGRRHSKSAGSEKGSGNMAVMNGDAGAVLARRRSSQRAVLSAGHGPKKAVKLRNLANDTFSTDTLHAKATEGTPCMGSTLCKGSFMWPVKVGPEPLRPKDEVMRQAREFFEEYYASFKRLNTPSHEKRWAEVSAQIESTGTYWLTLSELTYGAKTAWRNAPRCIGRIQWSKLQVFDARHIKTARGMFEAVCNHMKYATNKGNIRSAITLFPPRTDGLHDFRIWNGQFIAYAGYRQADGSIIGDPANAELTELCLKLGWKGPGGQFDVLPLVLQAYGNDPEIYDVPPELILEVPIEHQQYPWFKELGLKWFALPAVSSMMLDLGGLQFTAAPFNGWYMGTEIGARDLLDKSRYNLLQPIGERLGLDTLRPTSLWKDRVVLEVNIAVLYSFQRDRVTISDHHSTAESFMKHMENETRVRGGCPADWVWVTPPMSSSITPVFHQEMLRYHLKPSYEYQVEPWLTHQWKKSKDKKKTSTTTARRKIGFKELARAVKFSAKLMGKALANRIKCTILYATETGKSETFAKRLCDIFQHAFNAKVLCMSDYDPLELEHEALVLIVTSTFGNGDPPDNGLEFAKGLLDMLHQDKGGSKSRSKEPKTETCPEPDSQAAPAESMTCCETDSDAAAPDSKMVPDRGTMLRVESLGSSRITRRRSSNFDLPKDSLDHGVGTLANISYSVFGLGSRAYPNYAAFAKLLNRLFSDLGAEVLFPPAEGDELCGQEQAFQVWADGVFRAACDTFCVGDDVNFAAASEAIKKKDSSWAPGKYRLTPLEGQKEPDLIKALAKLHNKKIHSAVFKKRTNLQADKSERQTILVEIDTTEYSDDLRYVPGDHVAVYPANQDELVDSILACLHNAPDPDQVVKLEILKDKPVFLGPGRQWYADDRLPPMTLRTAFSRYLDVTTPPTPDLLHQFSALADDADAKRLEQLSSDSDLYENWKFSSFPTLATVLSEFASLRVSPTFMLSQLPLLQPRFYSISSSPAMHPGEIHATVAVVCFTSQGGGGIVHHGVCSSWLNRIKEDTIVPCLVRSAPSFHLPITETLPIIMVGPGTGIAPFRSFWQQRRVDRDMRVQGSGEGGATWGPMTLYSGCRQAKIDNIYAEEKSQALADGILTDVHTALSREPNIPKAYVQNLMTEHSSAIYNQMMLMRGHFYVCGDVSMAAEVCATLERILMKEGKKSSEEAKRFILKLRETNRFHEDIFGVTLRTSEVHDKKRDEARKLWSQASTLAQASECTVTAHA